MLRRLFQYRLRTALITTASVGVLLGLCPYLFGPYDEWLVSQLRKPLASSRYPHWTDTSFPAGNESTQDFLRWAAAVYPTFCAGTLDGNGDLVTLSVHPCWPTDDAQLEKISRLKTVKLLSLSAENVTDRGFAHLASMTALREIDFCETDHVTDSALDRLRQRRPNIVMTLPDRP
jgi:hypothetical protein